MDFASGQTAVLVPVLAAEPVVGDWRERYDPAALLGVPAHVTVVFPFVPFDQLDVSDVADLQAIMARQPRFTARFTHCARFPDVLYLAPDDEAPFRTLTEAVVARWPQAPPYGAAYADVIPHLTVTDRAGAGDSARAEAAVTAQLPVIAEIAEAWLMAFDGARWRRQATVPLA